MLTQQVRTEFRNYMDIYKGDAITENNGLLQVYRIPVFVQKV
ncbi:hypothetical protein [Spirosoma linguale]